MGMVQTSNMSVQIIIVTNQKLGMHASNHQIGNIVSVIAL